MNDDSICERVAEWVFADGGVCQPGGASAAVALGQTSAWSAILGTAIGMSCLVILVLPPAMVGAVAGRWADDRRAAVMEHILISWAAALLIGLPLACAVLSRIMAIPNVAVQEAVIVFVAVGLLSLRLWFTRRHAVTRPERCE